MEFRSVLGCAAGGCGLMEGWRFFGGPPEKWELALATADLTRAAHDAAVSWDDDGYNHAEWFFGTEPAWRGYSLGHFLVRQFLNEHPYETPAKLVHAEADKFRGILEKSVPDP